MQPDAPTAGAVEEPDALAERHGEVPQDLARGCAATGRVLGRVLREGSAQVQPHEHSGKPAGHREHRRRVEQRQPDLEGQVVPTWEQVLAQDYELWNEDRDGPRLLVESSSRTALEEILRYVEAGPSERGR